MEQTQVSLNNNFEVQEITGLNEKDKNEETNKAKKAKRNKKQIKVANPQLNFVISTYYKGTGLEEVLKKMEEYIDEKPKDSTEITSI